MKLFEKIENAKYKSGHRDGKRLGLITQVESGLGLLNLHAICKVDTEDVTESTAVEHVGLMFGGDDFAASIGMSRPEVPSCMQSYKCAI